MLCPGLPMTHKPLMTCSLAPAPLAGVEHQPGGAGRAVGAGAAVGAGGGAQRRQRLEPGACLFPAIDTPCGQGLHRRLREDAGVSSTLAARHEARPGVRCSPRAQMCDTDQLCVCACQVRVGFYGGEDLWVEDVLNIGVDPGCAEWACLCFSPCSGVAQSRTFTVFLRT